ncbi:MFS transporter [Lentzea sp. NPDC051208]|uniref:MFS transporter n=1 Tax=Lentzea sp. NPDC051208 TaxID=3154642 RepID=UPI00341B96CD
MVHRSDGASAVVPRPASADGAGTALRLVSLLLVAACLRPTLTSVGPVLTSIGEDENLSRTALGMLGTVPLVAFAIVAPAVNRQVRRVGVERAVVLASLGLAGGTLLRSLPGVVMLWAGTAAAAVCVAVGNVLLPSLVKRDYADRTAEVTGACSTVMALVAAVASATAVPLAAQLPGWRWSLVVWALPALVVAVVWWPRVQRTDPFGEVITENPRTAPLWRSAVAWQVTAFFGLQSTSFYLLITWLPSIESARGSAPATAGWHLFLYQVAGIVACLAVTPLLGRRTDQRISGVVVSFLMAFAMCGMLLAPGAAVLWVLIAGTSSGAAFVLALTVIGLRCRTTGQTTRLSGMAQTIGYGFAAAGPVAAGWLNERLGTWTPVLMGVVAIAVVQLTVSWWTGRPRQVQTG